MESRNIDEVARVEAPAGGRRKYFSLARIVGFCIACVVINVVGAQLALVLHLPIYFDSLGTVLAGILGGYVPAIAVGYLTNIINSITDGVNFYYGIVSVLIALCTAFFAERGWFKRLPMIGLAILVLALIGGGLGSALTYFVEGMSLGKGPSAPFVLWLVQNAAFDPVGAQIIADLFVDLVDKTLVVLSAVLIYNLMPESWLEWFSFLPWQQRPLSDDEMDSTLHTKSRGVSLRTKIIAIVVVIMALVALATTVMCYVTFHNAMLETDSAKAKGITNLMADQIDPDRIDLYLEKGDEAPGYDVTEKRLAQIRDAFSDVEYVYVYKIMHDGCHVVFDPDTVDTPGTDPGEVIPFEEAFQKYVPTLLAGGEIDPIVSNDTYGWLLTIYSPLKNAHGETVCYVAADISMNDVMIEEISFLARIVALFAAFLIVVCAVVLWLAKFGLLLPVNSISRASEHFMVDNESARSSSIDQIGKLDIRTGDEIEALYNAVNQMSHETIDYIAEAQNKNETIDRMQSNLIMVMADLVESRDKFTGDHVRNTATYTKIVMNQMRREGIYPDQLTNEFISNVYKSAPLHDVGKIVVSDTILNKPGRFTDEEFEIMKSHTVAGRDILESAKGAVSESSYLDEAQNLAAYHHEKWNGTGYPFGLSGEDIPLSARIMAVADVFDALVSKRSYKEGFPVEKALAIIEEGVGTHFDPQVARAFLHAKDKAIAVAEKSNEKKRIEEELARAEREAQEELARAEREAEEDGGAETPADEPAR